MTDKEFTSIFAEQINRLSQEKLVGFAIIICNRLLPDYIDFWDHNNWGDPVKLKEGIAFCEENNNTLNPDPGIIKKMCDDIIEVMPDTEDFEGENCSYALNAAVAICETLNYLVDKDLSHIIGVSRQMTDTIYFKISEKEEHLSYAALDAHSRMAGERLLQLAMIGA